MSLDSILTAGGYRTPREFEMQTLLVGGVVPGATVGANGFERQTHSQGLLGRRRAVDGRRPLLAPDRARDRIRLCPLQGSRRLHRGATRRAHLPPTQARGRRRARATHLLRTPTALRVPP